MNLLSQLLNKKEVREYFLTFGIEKHRIRAAISQVSEDGVTLVGSAEKNVASEKDFSEAADMVVTEAEKNLPEGQLVKKVIFSLPINYTHEDKIKNVHLGLLKKICHELELEPFGFIDYPSAISYFFEKEEGSPPTLLLVYISRECLDVTFIRVGKIFQNVTLPLSEKGIIADFENAISQMNSDILPSRIILYDDEENLDSLKENFLKIPWHKQPSFLHTPKIDILPPDKIISALVESTGSSLVKNLQLEHKTFIEELPAEKEKADNLFRENKILPEQPAILINHQKSKEELELDNEHFGFAPTKKDQTRGNTSPSMEKHHIHPEHTAGGDEHKHLLTQVTGREATGIPFHHQAPVPLTKERANALITIPLKQPQNTGAYESDKKKGGQIPASNFPKLPDIPLPVPNLSLGIFVIIFLILGFIAELVYSYIFFPRAEVKLVIYPLQTSGNTDVMFTADSQKVSPDKKNIIALKSVNSESSSEKTIATTGKTRIGDRAKGEVTIYNKTMNSKVLPKGTVISGNNLSFFIDNDAKIASSSETGEGLIFGKSTVPVTAAGIGPEANLAADTQFRFKDFPDTVFSAKNQKPFSGGTSREVDSISKEDRDRLENLLTEELTVKAKQQMLQKLGPDDALIDNGITVEKTSKNFSAEAGEQGKELNLNLTLKVTGLTFDRNDIKALSDNISSAPGSIPDGFIPDKNRFAYQINNSKQDKNGNISASIKLISFYLPELNSAKILNDISGKSYTRAADIIRTYGYIAGVKIVKEQGLSFFNNSLPVNKNRIILSIVNN